MKPNIIYVFDPLCGWCYGFTPVMLRLKKKYSKEFDFEIVSGGMIVGNRVSPITQIAPYIAQAYKKVETLTGIQFGEKFLQNTLWDNSVTMNSLPPSQALMCFKNMRHEQAFEFAHALQTALYYEGIPLDNESLFINLASTLGVDPQAFKQQLDNPDNLDKTIEDFKKTTALGVEGFPTVLLMHADAAITLSHGYISYQQLERKLIDYRTLSFA